MDYYGNTYHGSCCHKERVVTNTIQTYNHYCGITSKYIGITADCQDYGCEKGELVEIYDWVPVSDSVFTTQTAQDICVVSTAVRWYTYKIICLSLDIPQYASVTINKTVYDKSGNIADVDDTFYFELVVDGTTVETIAVATKNGEGTATSTKILLENGSAGYSITEVSKDGYSLDTSKSSGMSRNTGGRFFVYYYCLGDKYNR